MVTLGIDVQRNGSGLLTFFSAEDFPQLAAIRSFLSDRWGCRLDASLMPSFVSGLLSEEQKRAIEKTQQRMSRRHLNGQCSGLTHRQGLLTEGAIEIQPLLKLLQAGGSKSLQLTVSLPPASVQELDAGFHVSPVERMGHWAFTVPTDEQGGPIHVKFGYRRADIAWISSRAGLYIVIPIVTLWVMRAIALRRGKDDAAAAWFSYMRTFQLCVNATFLLWCGTELNPRQQMMDLFSFLGWDSGWRQVLNHVLTLMVPAWAVYLTCTMLSYKVFTRIKNAAWTRADFLKEQFAALGKVFFPLGFVVAAVMTTWQNPRIGVLLFLLAFLSSLICSSLAQRFARMHPAAVTAGPLRDRIFEMANRMGVKLRQVIVVSATKTSTANAFATARQTIIFTDYLINKLSQREVNAVAGHELTHLRHNHAQKSVITLWVAIFLPGIFNFVVTTASGFLLGLLFLLGNPEHLLNTVETILASPWTQAAVLLAGFAGFFYLRRRFEYTADFGAAAITGDPEAAITGLLKISRLGLLPIQWGRASETMLTHPSTLRRVQRIAAAFRIAPEKLQQLVHSVASAEAPADTEQGPSYVVTENTPGVVSIHKAAGQPRLRLLLLILFHILPAAAVAFAVQHLPPLAPWQLWVMLGGLAGSVVVYHFVVRGLACSLRRRHAADARRAAQTQLGPFQPEQAVAVGFAPGPSPRYFVAGYNWDHGVLFFTPEKIVFAGEHLGFALTRDQIRLIVPGEGGPGWMKAPRLYFAWLDKKTGRHGTFNITVLDQKSWFSHPADARALYQRLRNWRNRSSDAAEFALATELGPPEPGVVTSMSPKEINKFSRWISMSLSILALAWALTIVAGLEYRWYVCLSALSLRLYEAIPYWRYKERAYVSDPVLAAPQGVPVPPPPPPVAARAVPVS
jgi:Zn-dependent protease with chaperone function